MIQDGIKQRVLAGLDPITKEMERAFTINGKLFIMQKLIPIIVKAGLSNTYNLL